MVGRELSFSDVGHIDKFCEVFGLQSNKIGDRFEKVGYKRHKMAYIEFTCRPMAEALAQLEFKKFPDYLDRNFALSWLLGFYDGDGTSGRSELCSPNQILLGSIKKFFDIRYEVSLKKDKDDGVNDILIKSSKPMWRLTLGAVVFNEIMKTLKK